MRDEFYNADLRGARMKAARLLLAIPAALAPQPQSGAAIVPPDLSPTTVPTFTPIANAVNYFGGPNYSLWSGRSLDSPNEEIKPLPNAYRRDLVITFASLVAARHLDEAELPQAIRSFITTNATSLKKPFLSYDCKGGQSADVSDMFSPGDQGPKNTRF